MSLEEGMLEDINARKTLWCRALDLVSFLDKLEARRTRKFSRVIWGHAIGCFVSGVEVKIR